MKKIVILIAVIVSFIVSAQAQKKIDIPINGTKTIDVAEGESGKVTMVLSKIGNSPYLYIMYLDISNYKGCVGDGANISIWFQFRDKTIIAYEDRSIADCVDKAITIKIKPEEFKGKEVDYMFIIYGNNQQYHFRYKWRSYYTIAELISII